MKGQYTYVAPAKNMSTVLARAMAESVAISKIVVIAIITNRVTKSLDFRHIILGVNRNATIMQAMRARATIVIEDPENICTFGSLEVT